MKLLLAALFFITALLYASVGFGGGSTYTALLILVDTNYLIVPVIALACNVLVVSGNVLRYGLHGHIRWARIWPLLVLSIPAAWVGGRLEISETLFIGLLAAALFLAGLRLLLTSQKTDTDAAKDLPLPISLAIGGAIGFYSGLVGIGGGIFLAPILHTLKWGSAKTIAAACSVFILFNSLSGIWGQLTKLSDMEIAAQALAYWPVLPAVIIGGFIGNRLGVMRLSELWLKRLTGVLILIVALRLCIRWLSTAL